MGVRITQQRLINTTLFNLQNSLNRIARLQDVLANGGKQLLRPSDEPEGIATALRLRTTRSELNRFSTNIDRVQPFIQQSEAALGEIVNQFINLRSITVDGADESLSPEARQALATEVDTILATVVNQANSDFAGRYVFGGTETRAQPFQDVGGFVQFNGNLDPIFEEIVDGTVVQVNTIGGAVFAGAIGVFTGTGDLSATLDDGTGGFDTPLAQLNSGAGVQAGTLTITDRNGAVANIPIAATDTIGDVIAAINGAGLDVTAQINPQGTGLFLEDTAAAPTGDLIVTGTGSTASDLGIEETAAGSILGEDLDPQATLSNAATTTLLGDLNNGAGIAFSTFTVQDKDGTIATVDLSGLGAGNTVQDVINAINAAGTNVVASLDTDGSGLLLSDTTSTGRNEIRVTEGPSTTATDLGLVGASSGTVLEGARLNPAADPAAPATLSTPLSLLADGAGITPQAIRVTNGTQTALVDLSGATTLGDVAAAIERAGVGLRVDVDSDGKRLILTSTTGNTPISVADAGQLGDARSLGLQAPNIFDTIIQVRQALLNDDTDTLTQLIGDIDVQLEKLNQARSDAGGRINQLDTIQERIADQQVNVETLITQTEDADISEVITQLFAEENTFEAALAVASRTLQRSLLDFLS